MSSVVNGICGHQRSNYENQISQEGNLSWFSCLACGCLILSSRTLTCFWYRSIVVWVTTGKSVKVFKHYIRGNINASQTKYENAPNWVKELNCFWWRSKSSLGDPMSNCENLVKPCFPNILNQKAFLELIFAVQCQKLNVRSWFMTMLTWH